jgi:hypothetical protein
MEKDINHTIRYYIQVFKRSVRDDVSPHFGEWWNSLSDAMNAIMRGVLSLLSLIFTLLADICNRWKEQCYRKKSDSMVKEIPSLTLVSKKKDINNRFFDPA